MEEPGDGNNQGILQECMKFRIFPFFILGYISDKQSVYPDTVKVLLAQEVLSNSVSNQLEVLRRNSEEFRMSLWLEHITRATQVIILEIYFSDPFDNI